MPLPAVEQLPVHSDVVGFRVSLGAKFCDECPIHLHASGRDQFFCLAPRSDARGGDYFL